MEDNFATYEAVQALQNVGMHGTMYVSVQCGLSCFFSHFVLTLIRRFCTRMISILFLGAICVIVANRTSILLFFRLIQFFLIAGIPCYYRAKRDTTALASFAERAELNTEVRETVSELPSFSLSPHHGH
jgi:hypothetical protein